MVNIVSEGDEISNTDIKQLWDSNANGTHQKNIILKTVFNIYNSVFGNVVTLHWERCEAFM